MKIAIGALTGFLLAALLLGRYEYVAQPHNNKVIWRGDRLTGAVALCGNWGKADERANYMCRSREPHAQTRASETKASDARTDLDTADAVDAAAAAVTDTDIAADVAAHADDEAANRYRY